MSLQMPPLAKPPGYRDQTVQVARPQPPPRRANLPQSFYPEKRKRKSHCLRCCCCCCIFFGIIILLFIAATGFLYLWFSPKLPEISLQSLKFTKMNVTNTPDGPVLDAQSTVNVVIRNPNSNLKLAFARTQLSLSSQTGVSIGEDDVPAFVQDKNNVTLLKFRLKSSQMILTDEQANELKSGFKNMSLKVSADIRTGIGTGYDSWTSEKAPVEVLCEAMTLKQMESGKTPNCRIRVFRWIDI